MKAQILKIEHHQSLLVYGALCLCALAIAFYGYFLNSAIRNVVARQKVEGDMTSLRVAQSGLESDYVALKDSVTLQSALALGFAEASDPLFISAAGPSKTALSYNAR
jgi:hypothetical protein